MTAPSRRNGRPVHRIYRGCERKQRYPDEFTARAAGRVFEEERGIELWLYRCDICRGWHLTKHPHRAAWRRVTYDFSRSSQADSQAGDGAVQCGTAQDHP